MFPKIVVLTFVALLLTLVNASPNPAPTPAPNPNVQLENRQIGSIISVVTGGGTQLLFWKLTSCLTLPF
jgi:hypothetical protein